MGFGRTQSTVPQLASAYLPLPSFAEIAIGIFVGCLPVLTRFFKHVCSTEAGRSSRLGILSSTSWRKLFRRSSTPKTSRKNPSYHYRNFIGKERSSRSTEAPHLETLNLTRISLELAEQVRPKIPSKALTKNARQ